MNLGQLTSKTFSWAFVLYFLFFTTSLLIAEDFTEIIFNFTLRDMKLKSADVIIILENIKAPHLCGVQCMYWSRSNQKTCKSINYNPALKKCELLGENSGRFVSELFKKQPGWEYYGQNSERQFECFKKHDTISCCLPKPKSTFCYLPSSCEEIKSQCPNCDSAYYNILSSGGISSKIYCALQGENTCKGIKQSCPTCGSGFYPLSFDDEDKTDVYCDMDVDNGGWMMIGNFTISSESNLFTASSVARSNISDAMAAIKNGQSSVLTMLQLQYLRSQKFFTEFRIKCYKPSVGHVLHLVLFKEDYINGLLHTSLSYIHLPKGEYYRALSDDASLIGGSLSAKTIVNPNLYGHAIFIHSEAHVQIEFIDRLECDDYEVSSPGFMSIGHWEFYVR